MLYMKLMLLWLTIFALFADLREKHIYNNRIYTTLIFIRVVFLNNIYYQCFVIFPLLFSHKTLFWPQVTNTLLGYYTTKCSVSNYTVTDDNG